MGQKRLGAGPPKRLEIEQKELEIEQKRVQNRAKKIDCLTTTNLY